MTIIEWQRGLWYWAISVPILMVRERVLRFRIARLDKQIARLKGLPS